MHLVAEKEGRSRIMHEAPGRIRVRNPVFHDPAFDPVHLEAHLTGIPGVTSVRFNLKAAGVVVRYDGSDPAREEIIRVIDNFPLLNYHPAAGREPVPDPIGAAAKGILALLTPAIPGPFRFPAGLTVSLPIFLEGLETLFTKGVKVEVLDAAAVGASLWRKDYITANSIVALLALGEYLEQLSEEKAGGLLRSLLRPRVESAWVEREGREIRLGLDEVVIGDKVVCGSGEMVPVDGLVVEGDADVNQAPITGESVPVHVKPNSEVISGSVVESGRIKVLARNVGGETSLARINRFLENSLRNKSKSQKESDRLADRLVPATLGLGLGLFLATRDVRRAAAVLTVDYSCAIKLANPVAVKTAMYAAAGGGVLLKGAQAMDALARVDTMVFDKTGTLTRGILEVTDVISLGGMEQDRLLALAAAAEEHYAHPTARAVVGEAGARGLALPPAGQVDFIVAHGVSAFVNGWRVLVGSVHFVEEDEGIDCSAAVGQAGLLGKQGKTLLYVARDGVLEGLIALRDILRPEAARVLRELKELGLTRLVMLTGDHADSARAAAEKLEALDQVYCDLKPEDKVALVKKFQEEGCVVAFAGDGVNDAPALVAAEVGICMPGGADLAREAAQVILLREDISALTVARQIAVRSQRTIRNCFIAAFGLNTLFLVLASGGRLAPAVAAVLHNANTVGILGYAALAGLKKPNPAGTE
ncbi:MAG: heavy metal translocating P-type ATPase [Pseudomonadota bacterium]